MRGTSMGAIALAGLAAVGSTAWAGTETDLSRALTPALAALLGAVQGATEFLPVSSSGHLSLAQRWLDIDASTAGHRFNIAVHAATLIAVLWVYRTDVSALLRVAVHPTRPTVARRRLAMMFLASLPLGIVLWDPIEAFAVRMEGEVRWIGAALATTAVILWLGFRPRPGATPPPSPEEPPAPWQAILIGLAQLFAVLPGISRSGTTIAAGIALGLAREQAARFSFLISLIAVGGASAKELLEVASAPPGQDAWAPFAVGFVGALVVGLVSLRGLVYLVGRGRVRGFVIYLLVLGTVAMVHG